MTVPGIAVCFSQAVAMRARRPRRRAARRERARARAAPPRRSRCRCQGDGRRGPPCGMHARPRRRGPRGRCGRCGRRRRHEERNARGRARRPTRRWRTTPGLPPPPLPCLPCRRAPLRFVISGPPAVRPSPSPARRTRRHLSGGGLTLPAGACMLTHAGHVGTLPGARARPPLLGE